MDIDQIKGLNAESLSPCEIIAGDISTDWEVDKAGIAYKSADKLLENLADLRDEFKESS